MALPMMDRKQIKDLTLALMYETAWEEDDVFGEKMLRTWKGYPFELIDELAEEGLINQSRKSKSVVLTDEGEEKAKRIVEILEKCGELDEEK